MILTSKKIYLRSMSLNQLTNLLKAPCKIDDDFNCNGSHNLLNNEVLPAINAKINKMKEVDEVKHLWFTYWVIILINTNSAIGLIGFKGEPDKEGEVEVGYGINQKFRRLGLATKALELLKGWAFESANCIAITAQNVLSENIASQKVLENSHFELISKDSQLTNWVLRRINKS
jgi:[ribosomal protein S5]-alanine N-acetyltransferase